MMKKAMVMGLMTCVFFAIAIGSVNAAETETITDAENDVINFSTSEMTNTKPNIDIKLVKYYRDEGSKTVELTLEVKGVIEDVGGSESDLREVSYVLYLETSESYYEVLYFDKECTDINYEELDATVDGYKLIVSFDLNSADETFVSLSADSMDYDYSLDEFFWDSAPDTYTLDVSLDVSSTGKVGEEIDFSATVEEGIPPYEWLWDFDGDEVTDSEEQNPSHVYDEAGTYNVNLIVYDSEEKLGMAVTTITISNGVTNNNGSNDDNNKENQGDLDDSESGLLMFVLLIVIIVIVVVAVLVYVMRR